MNRRIWPHLNDRKTVSKVGRKQYYCRKFLDDKAIRNLFLTVWS